MKESYSEGLAKPRWPRVMRRHRKGSVEALTGVRAGEVLSLEILEVRDADVVPTAEGTTWRGGNASLVQGPAGSETLCTPGNTSRENREIPCPPSADDGAEGRVGKSQGRSRR